MQTKKSRKQTLTGPHQKWSAGEDMPPYEKSLLLGGFFFSNDIFSATRGDIVVRIVRIMFSRLTTFTVNS